MKHIYFAFALFFVSAVGMAQVIVDGKDLNEEVEMFEVYTMVKPFSTKETIFANSGSNNFRLHYYDHKRQAIYNAEGKKFEKGQYLELYTYLTEQGWYVDNERPVKLGNNTGKAIIFKKKKKE